MVESLLFLIKQEKLKVISINEATIIVLISGWL